MTSSRAAGEVKAAKVRLVRSGCRLYGNREEIDGPQKTGLKVYLTRHILREFVLRTTVILTPGACGREVPSGSPWTGSGGKSGNSGSPDGYIFEHFICVFTVKTSRVTKRYNVFFTFS